MFCISFSRILCCKESHPFYVIVVSVPSRCLMSIGLLAPSNRICCFVSPAAWETADIDSDLRLYSFLSAFVVPRVYPTRHGPNLMTEALVKKPSQISCNCLNSESLFPVGFVQPASSASSIIRLVDSSTLPPFLFSVHLSYKSFQSLSVGKLPFLYGRFRVILSALRRFVLRSFPVLL